MIGFMVFNLIIEYCYGFNDNQHGGTVHYWMAPHREGTVLARYQGHVCHCPQGDRSIDNSFRTPFLDLIA